MNPAFHPSASSVHAGGPNVQPFNSRNSASGSPPWGSDAGSGNASRSATSPPRTVAGHKRKLDALRGPRQDIKKPEPPTAPSIPGFGNPIIPQRQPADTGSAQRTSSKRTSNVLGLNPQEQTLQYSSDSDGNDDEADEEAMYAELGSNLTFEHEGRVLSLNTVADLAAWKDERSKNFPTKDRLAAKLEQKRQIGDERRRLLMEAAKALRSIKPHQSTQRRQSSSVNPESGGGSNKGGRATENGHSETRSPESELEKIKRQVAEQAASLEALRQKVSAGEARLARASNSALSFGVEAGAQQSASGTANTGESSDDKSAATALVGDGKSLVGEADHEDAVQAPASSSSSSTTSDASSDEDSDDDGPPEEVTSKAAPKMQGTSQTVCKFFAASGHCRDGNACAFKHEPRNGMTAMGPPKERPAPRPRLAPSGSNRKGIHDLLVEQEQGQENRLALQVIKHLGRLGFFADAKTESTDAQ